MTTHNENPRPQDEHMAETKAEHVAEAKADAEHDAEHEHEHVDVDVNVNVNEADHEHEHGEEGKPPRKRQSRQTKMTVGEDVPPRLLSIVESLLFASVKPLKPSQIQKLLGERSPARVRRVLRALVEIRADSGVSVLEVDGGFQLRTNPENARWVRRLEELKPVRMSRASLEVLAVVAYRQPVTRAEIDQIRGVDSGGALKLLLSRDLVRILGRKEEPGRPFLYGTTHEFLSFFSLSSLSELPPLRDVSDLAATQAEEDEPAGGEDVQPPAGEDGATGDGDDQGPHPPSRPAEPPEISPEEIAVGEDELDELDGGDDEVFEALEEASDAARGADRVKRTLKKMAQAEAEAGPSSPEAGRMLESIEQLVASRRKRKQQAEEEAAGDEPPTEGDQPAGAAPDTAAEPPAKPPARPQTPDAPPEDPPTS
jgi:segregation and condensation protein B